MKRTLLLLLMLTGTSASAADRKPNFLFIYTDDQRWDAMGVVQREQGERARFPWFKSPSMDRLAAEGVRFRNAFVTLSLCAPSRAAFLTGRYNHLNGITNNDTAFPADSVTHATLLRAAGYRTAYIGKWHMGNQRGQRPGFDYSASFIGHGRYQDCPVEINGVSTPTKGWLDDVSTDFAIEWMKQNRDRPFSMVVGFKSPHSPRGGDNLPARLRNLYAGETSRPTPNCGVPAIFHKPDPEDGQAPDRPRRQRRSPRLPPPHRRSGRESRPLARRPRRTRPRRGHGRRLHQRQRLLPRRALLGRQAFALRRVAPHPDARALPAPLRQGPGGGRDGAQHRSRPDVPRSRGRARSTLRCRARVGRNSPPDASRRTGASPSSPNTTRNSATCPRPSPCAPTTHKLVKYPNRPEWTEVFDLVADPYEMKNLAADSALTAKLGAELDAQMKTVNYTLPANANKPREAARHRQSPAPKSKPDLSPLIDIHPRQRLQKATLQ